MNSQAALLAAALAAAERGWQVFPLRAGSKKPALHGDSPLRPCPRTGVCRDGHQGWEQRATGDPERIRAAWARGAFNVGIAAGPSGLLVVDLDTPKSADDVPPESWNRGGIRDGRDVFAAVCAQHGHPAPWETHQVGTARGGTHLYYQTPPDVRLRNTEGEQGTGLGWKVDTRGWGGYVVAAGSITPHGSYQTTLDGDPITLPTWLAERLTPTPPTPPTVALQPTKDLPAYVEAAIRGEAAHVADAPGGQHTRTVFNAALTLGRLTPHHLPPETAVAVLLSAAGHIITGPCECTTREIERTIRNGLRYGANRPRHLDRGVA